MVPATNHSSLSKVEAMAQLGGLICLQEPCSDGKGTFFFGGVDGVSQVSAVKTICEDVSMPTCYN